MENSQLYQDINKHPIIQLIGPMDCETEHIRNDLPTIFVDGGRRHFSEINTNLSYFIGDGDSLEEAQELSDFDHKLPEEKDVSDLGYVLEQIEANKSISMHGFLGGRLDHQLFVMGEVHHFIFRTGSEVSLDQSFLWPARNSANGEFDYEFDHQGLFSVGCLEESVVTIFGDCKYPVNNIDLNALSSRGLSNVAHGKVHFKSNKPFWIYRA